MAKKIWNNPIDKNVDWGGDDATEGLPVSGEMIQKFIKESLNSKAGIFYYDTSNNRYLVFADAEDRDLYLQDPTLTSLIIGTFDAPFNYTATINLTSKTYNAVFLNSTGNYIDFTFDVVNKQGASTGENVTVTYTFIRNANKQVVTETKKFGDVAHFNIDKYLGEGTNTIMVGITGQTSLAATTVAITYQVVNLSLTDDINIAKSYNITNGPQQVEVPFTVSGYGTKVVEWYIDGELLPFVKSEDEVVDVSTSRTKYITLSNLSQGAHSLQIRAYTVINGEHFYTDTLYRDLLVYTGTGNDVIIGIATTIPRDYGIISPTDVIAIYDIVQYVPYTLRFATYSPLNAANTDVTISIDDKVKGVVGSKNGTENLFVITSTTYGNQMLKLSTTDSEKEVVLSIKKTTMNIQEIEGAVLDFTANDKTNGSTDRDTWTDGIHTATLTGFNWNNSSGWVNGRLEMAAGSSLAIDYAPLGNNPTGVGKTIEIEWKTKNVTNDNAVICDLRGENGVGILITATKVSMISADGVVIETEYKSDENVRIGFIINKSRGVTNRRLSFIYTNGIVSRAEQWATTDNYNSDAEILFTATNEAEISLKSIKVYDNALSSDNMLNNFILYRDTISEMMEVYDRNDVYEEGTTTFSPEKMMNRLPVMIVTGDIPTLENTSDTDTQIVVDIEYYNLQDPTKSFKMTGAAMRPQGTSSMGYPKKNFRIYTQKVDGTIVYDSEGKVVEDKLYSFKEGAQPVNCWCLKADYAESSGTHNTGIARLWNEALKNAQVDGEYVCRTEAQKAAIAAGYQYDVRTTIDGFPILLFYRPSVDDNLIFIGKYNFNNDKSTESVFGFTGIPGFNNEKMQCWEILNNGNALALFTSTEGFDTGWSEAFESRYPDTKTPYTGDLKAFCEWMSNVTAEDFKTEKWEHLNMYMIAAYWVYLMRHAAADQFVKNAMLTSEDGQRFYFILYDNDTINGLINTGRLRISPTDGRQTVDETGSYVFAGHDSRLWNLLEADDEFKNLVSEMDNALYSAGISYANTIKVFDEDQADKWVARVYNQDAQYKYIGPYVEKGIDNLFMLQGKRDLYRKWWLAKRFSIFDAKYVSGTYKSQAIEVKCLNGTPSGQKFTIKAGYPIDYGYGINNIPRSFGIPLNVGDSHTFTTQEVINLGDPLRIYGAPNLAEVDFSQMSDRLAVMNIASVYDDNLGTKLTKLVLGNPDKINAEVSEISGLKQAIALEELDIQGMTKMISIDLSNHQYFKRLKAFGSNLASVTFAKGAPVERVELPTTMRVLTFEQLPLLDGTNVVMEDMSNVQYISITNCPNISNDFEFINNWYKSKTSDDKYCSLLVNNVNWNVSTASDFIDLLSLKTHNALSLKGVVSIPNITIAQVYEIIDILGETAFDPNAELYIDIPAILQINSDTDTMLDGSTLQLSTLVYPSTIGTYEWSVSGRDKASIDNNGLLTVFETGLAESSVVVSCKFTSEEGEVITASKTIGVIPRVYPSSVTISGNADPRVSPNYSWETTTEDVNGDTIAEWTLGGNAATYWSVSNANSQTCTLTKKSAMPSNTTGTLTLVLKKRFDGSTITTVTKNLSMTVIFPANATINGNTNPAEGDSTYTWATTTTDVNGEYYAEWELSGDITNIVEITSQDTNSCVMSMLIIPTDLVPGMLTLTLKKSANDDTIVTATKTLEVMLEGVIITKTSNPGVQAALYNAGLVANEGYSLKEEVKKITADQLQPGTSYSTSIFYPQRNNIRSFDEFQYFTGLTKIPNYCFYYCLRMQKIKLPSSITEIGKQSFYRCQKLQEIEIPETVNIIGEEAFSYCTAFTEFKFPDKIKTLGDDILYRTGSITDIYLPSIIEDMIESWKTVGSSTRIHIKSFASWVSFRFRSNLSTFMVSGAMLYLNGEPVTHFIVPEGTTSLGRCALYNLKGVTDITIPDSVTTIEFQAIGHSDLQRIHGGKGLKTINVEALDGVSENLQIDKDCTMVALYSSIGNYRYSIEYTTENVNGSTKRPTTVMIGSVKLYAYNGGKFTDGTKEKNINLQQTGRIVDLAPLYPIGYITIKINSNFSDVEFIVSYTSFTGESKEKTVLAESLTEFDMDGATEFSIVAKNEYSGYNKPVYTYSMPTINYVSITLNYEEIQGIYIQHIDGTLYTTDEWTASGYANDQANGVALTNINTSFVIAKENVSDLRRAWGGYNKSITDICTTSSFYTAVLDFDGENNTPKIIEQLSGYTDSKGVTGAPAAEACVAYVFPNGKTGYLGASGQWQAVSNNKTAVNSAMSLIGGTALSNTYYWTSTQYSNTHSWCSDTPSNTSSYAYKSISYPVRAFCSLT